MLEEEGGGIGGTYLRLPPQLAAHWNPGGVLGLSPPWATSS